TLCRDEQSDRVYVFANKNGIQVNKNKAQQGMNYKIQVQV
ncbi:unnamed protein product, partial [marine sediment metagenome]